MTKLITLAFLALGLAVGCSSSPVASRTTTGAPSPVSSTAASLVDPMLPSVAVPEELMLTAAVSKTCRCVNGWQFQLLPSCTQPRCMNLCVYGQGYGGQCI